MENVCFAITFAVFVRVNGRGADYEYINLLNNIVENWLRNILITLQE